MRRCLVLLLLTTITASEGRAQAAAENRLLDVYKIDFAYYVEEQDDVKPKPKNTEEYEITKKLAATGKLPFTIYAHVDYVCQVDRSIDSTVWLIQHRAGKAIEIRENSAFVMDSKDFIDSRAGAQNFYFSGEAVTDSSKVYAIITLTNDTMMVAGYACRRAMVSYSLNAVRYGDTKLDIEVWYCPELPAYYGSGSEYLEKIPGAALYILYDTGHNTKLGFKAKSIIKQKKPVSFFEIPKGIEITYPVEMPPMH